MDRLPGKEMDDDELYPYFQGVVEAFIWHCDLDRDEVRDLLLPIIYPRGDPRQVLMSSVCVVLGFLAALVGVRMGWWMS